ncbi:MAG: hypothetical protein AB1750_18290, partial [Chloroflexota bacterium]
APVLSIAAILLAAIACLQPLDMGFQQSYAVSAFFDALNKGQYDQAAEWYGGDYESLAAMNPDLDPNDHAALWKRACEVNGFQCLTVRFISFHEETERGEYVFIVGFNAPDGSLFVQQAGDGSSVSEFGYRVLAGADGVWRVIDLPVYVP